MKNNKGRSGSLIAAYSAAVLCVFLLAFICTDCEKYGEKTVPASISYTPPEKAEDEGFWEIFSDAVVRLFKFGD